MNNEIRLETDVRVISANIVEDPAYPGIEVSVEEVFGRRCVALIEVVAGKIIVRTWSFQDEDPRSSFDVLTGDETT